MRALAGRQHAILSTSEQDEAGWGCMPAYRVGATAQHACVSPHHVNHLVPSCRSWLPVPAPSAASGPQSIVPDLVRVIPGVYNPGLWTLLRQWARSYMVSYPAIEACKCHEGGRCSRSAWAASLSQVAAAGERQAVLHSTLCNAQLPAHSALASPPDGHHDPIVDRVAMAGLAPAHGL